LFRLLLRSTRQLGRHESIPCARCDMIKGRYEMS
jgi:hypothetical protein